MKIIKGVDLKAMRQFAKLTTVQMAEAAGVKTRKTYENWEKEVGCPSVNQFFQMVAACGLNYKDVLEVYLPAQKQNMGDTGSQGR
ncbi:helix-turn-helix transcriptional regulator [Paraneptunicella aestuarii]|uniref:helix-turn-helix transcriptional regulator n=1 Tax=Paraneptunicella aestuarii TaxID=2831148 RepID=UPI001E37B57A|nr:helix-turn-helix transcriptional regulator [Paraneptunicella aestuarii]